MDAKLHRMNSADYARRYSEMSDGQLAQLVSEGRDNLTPPAREALDRELQKRGLNEQSLAQEYPAQHQHSSPADAPPAARSTGESKMKTIAAIAIFILVAIIACMFPGMPLNRHQWVDPLTIRPQPSPTAPFGVGVLAVRDSRWNHQRLNTKISTMRAVRLSWTV